MTTASLEAVRGWSWLDAVWALIMGAFLLRGFLRGMVQEVLELAGLGLAAYAGLRTYVPLGDWLMAQLPGLPEQAARAGAFAAVAAAVSMVAAAVTGMLVHLTRLSPLSWVDSLGGAAMGGLKGLAVVAALVVLASARPDAHWRATLGESRISRELRLALPGVWAGLRRALAVDLPPLPALEEPSSALPAPPAAPRRSPSAPPRPGGPPGGGAII